MFRKTKDKNATNPELKILLQKGGNTYYTFADKPRAHRYLIGMMNVEYATMGVDSIAALEYLDKIIESENRKDSAQASYYALTFKNRILAANPETAYMQLATVYVLLNDESPESYSKEIAKDKIAMWNRDDELKSFFLTFAYSLIQKSQNRLGETSLAASTQLAVEIISGAQPSTPTKKSETSLKK